MQKAPRRRAVLTGILGLLMTPAMASAHAHLTGLAIAGKQALLTLELPHGCDGADTYEIRIDVPPDITAIRPLPSVFGDARVETVAEKQNRTLVWKKQSDGAPDTQFYVFTFRAQIPDAPFTRLYFPTLQRCRGADGTFSELLWMATADEHAHGDATADEAAPAPSVFVFPPRHRGWNFYVVDQHVHDLSVFSDAEIVWSQNAAFSANPHTARLIDLDDSVNKLVEIHPGTEIWVKY